MRNKEKAIIYSLIKEEWALFEKKKKELPPEEDISMDLSAEEIPSDELPIAPPLPEPSMDMGIESDTSAEKRIGQGLQMALDAAKEMPDGETKDKLIRQIGNTALFFLKTQIPTGGAQL